MRKLGRNATETKEYDHALIYAIYDERGKTNTHGKLAHFPNSSDAIQAGIKGRYASERMKAQRALNNESDY